MKLELIQALKESIKDLESGKRAYVWSLPESCNCGILAQVVQKESAVQIKERGANCAWSFDSNDKPFGPRSLCKTTNAPLKEVVDKLRSLGFKDKDFWDLENLGNKDVLAEAGLDREKAGWSGFRDNKRNLIKYMSAWVTLLEKECKLEHLNKLKEETT